jgi:hypothetical protein
VGEALHRDEPFVLDVLQQRCLVAFEVDTKSHDVEGFERLGGHGGGRCGGHDVVEEAGVRSFRLPLAPFQPPLDGLGVKTFTPRTSGGAGPVCSSLSGGVGVTCRE